MRKKLVSIVVPFFNEKECVEQFYIELTTIMDSCGEFDFEVICVDDGSFDGTLASLVHLVALDERFQLLELTRNFGKESALTAGIDAANGDAVIPFDADLQDPPEVIPALLLRWQQGAEIVNACRIDRGADSFLKRKSAEWFYRLHNQLSHIKIPENVGDFRLLDRVVIESLKKLPERQRFMKGIFAWVGYRTETINYVRNSRAAGSTKFSGWKLWNFALEGITSFSTAPLKVWTYFGACGALLTVAYSVFIVLRTLIYGVDVPGYTSLFVAIIFFGSVQLIGIGVLGEYMGRIYIETKQRPTYLIRKIYKSDYAS